MYEEFYGLKERPFNLIPDPDYLYLSPQHKLAKAYLEYGISQRVGFVVLTGEIVEQARSDFMRVPFPAASRDGIGIGKEAGVIAKWLLGHGLLAFGRACQDCGGEATARPCWERWDLRQP